ncbi:hypothetical protein [Luteolibacter sp. AS25]|uniref:hypothetical protein n=1 Tax=Luteolibacter sp. AS25 TaxID=3135776 RepID=UPI00398BB729
MNSIITDSNMFYKTFTSLNLLLLASIVGCATGGGPMGDMAAGDDGSVGGISEVPNPTPEMSKISGKPLSQLQRGHEVYMLKCGECHEYQLPQKVDIMDWEDAMPTMITHAGLASSDEQAVLDYVVGVKKQNGQEY